MNESADFCTGSRIDGNCPHVDESAKAAVKMVFAILGVNIDVPKDVEEFRENLRFGATLRRAIDKGFTAVAVLIATSIAAATWVGITSYFGKGH